MPAYKVLFRLVHDPEVPQHELAWDAAMDPGAISRLIRDMAEDGLVTTRVDPKDKRQRFVRLTAKGRELEGVLSPLVDAALEPFQTVLSEKEQTQLLALMQKACEGVIERAQAQLAADEAERPKKAGSVKRVKRSA